MLHLVADGLARSKADAAHEAGVSVAVINGLIDEGTLEVLELPAAPVMCVFIALAPSFAIRVSTLSKRLLS